MGKIDLRPNIGGLGEITMATRKRAKKRSTRSPAAVETPLLFHRIHALLQTMRCIAQYEDELCTLLHASRSRDGADAALDEELRSILELMPSGEYSHDLESVRAALPAASKGLNKARPAAAGAKSASHKKFMTAKPVAKRGRQKGLIKRTAAKKAVAKKLPRKKTLAQRAKRTTGAAAKAAKSVAPSRRRR